jgi:hypothetical protein
VSCDASAAHSSRGAGGQGSSAAGTTASTACWRRPQPATCAPQGPGVLSWTRISSRGNTASPSSVHQQRCDTACLRSCLRCCPRACAPAESKDVYGLDPIRMKELVLANTDINWVVSTQLGVGWWGAGGGAVVGRTGPDLGQLRPPQRSSALPCQAARALVAQPMMCCGVLCVLCCAGVLLL